ncbi:MAG TPA: hypothetical protein VGB64_07745 [Actinomycetota bacterium]
MRRFVPGLALVVILAGLPHPGEAASPWIVSMTASSTKLVCQQAYSSSLRFAGPWRIPDRWTHMWGADFPYEFHGGLQGDNCALMIGPAAAVARATTTTAPKPSGSTPLKVYVDCWRSLVTTDPLNGNLFRRYPVPASGVIVARFQIGQGDLCRISAGAGQTAWPFPAFPGPMHGSNAAESQPDTFVARDKLHCMPMGSHPGCVFRIRTTPHTRTRLQWSADFTGRLRMSERSGPWTRVTECDVLQGLELGCAVVASPGSRPSGGITIVVGEPVVRLNGSWMVGADSRPVWPA